MAKVLHISLISFTVKLLYSARCFSCNKRKICPPSPLFFVYYMENSGEGGQFFHSLHEKQQAGWPNFQKSINGHARLLGTQKYVYVFSRHNMTIWCYRKHQLQNLDVEIKKWNQITIICSITTFLFLTKKEKDAFNLTYLSKNAEIPTKERTLLNTQLQF